MVNDFMKELVFDSFALHQEQHVLIEYVLLCLGFFEEALYGLLVFQTYLDLILLLDCCIQFHNLNGFLLHSRFGRLRILGDSS